MKNEVKENLNTVSTNNTIDIDADLSKEGTDLGRRQRKKKLRSKSQKN